MQYLCTQIQCIRVLWAQAAAYSTQFSKRTWFSFLRLTLCNIESVQLPPLGSPAHCSTAPSTASNTSHCSRFTRLPNREQRGGGVGGGRAAYTNKQTHNNNNKTNTSRNWLNVQLSWSKASQTEIFTWVLTVLSQFSLSVLSLKPTADISVESLLIS